jgi:tetratricopeptide (TPR) repeat protein
MRNIRLKGVFLLSIAVLLTASCSVKKNRFTSRAYHKTLAHYNGYFNAREKIREGIKNLAASKPDQYDRILSVFPHGDEASSKSIYPEMDAAIKKVSIVIQRHSMDIEGRERNKWIPKSYLIIGQAQFLKYETWNAIESFNFVAAQFRDYPEKYEALIWLAQCYLRLGKTPDAQYLLSSLSGDPGMPAKFRSVFHATHAQYFLFMNDYEEAAKSLEKAISFCKKRSEKVRYAFILGQIYNKISDCPKAVAAYDRVIKLKPVYEVMFNAKVNRARCVDLESEEGKGIRLMLEKMLKDEKNADYLDQIYYSLAEISLREEKIPEAIGLLKQSTANSTSNVNQKALSYLKLAEIYFKQPDYKLAQAYYDSTVSFITEDHPDYYTIKNTHSSLTKLISYLNIIQSEDSLQSLAILTPAQREAYVDSLIAAENKLKEEALKKKKEMELAEKEAAKQQSGDPNFNSRANNTPAAAQGGWYFSNPSAISFGFNEFIKLWGQRKLEDNWRRSNKAISSITDSNEEEQQEDTLDRVDPAVRDSIIAANNAKRKKQYLDAIPSSSEKLDSSNVKIVEAYYNVGLIYKEQLKDYKESGSNFETLLKRYPENAYKLPTMYNLYRVYLLLKDTENADKYKNALLNGYPDSEYARLILNPDYYKDLEKKAALQRVYYETTYRAYLNKQYGDVIDRKEMADSLFPGSDLAPRFELLNALAIGRSKSIQEFEVALKKVVASYPSDTVSTRAKEILALINPSMYGLKDSVKSAVENANQNISVSPTTPFSMKADTVQYIMFLFPNNNVVGSNELKVALSNYNNKFYSVKKLQISNSFIGMEYQFVMVRQFNDMNDAMGYLTGLLDDVEAFQEIDMSSVSPLIITPENLLLLVQTKDLAGYEEFYNSNYHQ